MTCRGLITDSSGHVLSRPFKKFFNLDQYTRDVGPLPDEPFEVFDKVDGSLGVSYFVNGMPFIATRGSFMSEQAGWANELLQLKYARSYRMLPELTYLFEIIVPQNRIVVDYGTLEQLVLLTVIETATGRELSYEEVVQEGWACGFPVVTKYNFNYTLDELKSLQLSNAEGFVLRYRNGLRVKSKMAEYLRLHRVLTNVSAKSIWEILKSDDLLDPILDRVPDEFYAWVQATAQGLKEQYLAKERIALQAYDAVKGLPTRKEQALQLAESPETRAVVFRMLDKRPYDDIIWKYVEPKADKPFRGDES